MNKILCFFGMRKPDYDYFLKWNKKLYYCTCKRCGKELYIGKG